MVFYTAYSKGSKLVLEQCDDNILYKFRSRFICNKNSQILINYLQQTLLRRFADLAILCSLPIVVLICLSHHIK